MCLILGLGIRGPKLSFFWFGSGLRYIMFCDVILQSVNVRNVMLIKEFAQGSARKVSHLHTIQPVGAKNAEHLFTVSMHYA